MSTWHEKLQKPFQSRSQVSSFSTVISPWVFWKRAPSHSAWSAPTAYGSDGTTLRPGQQFVHRSNGRWISAAPSNRQLPYFRPRSPRWSGRCCSRFFLQNKPEQAEYLVTSWLPEISLVAWFSVIQSSNLQVFFFGSWTQQIFVAQQLELVASPRSHCTWAAQPWGQGCLRCQECCDHARMELLPGNVNDSCTKRSVEHTIYYAYIYMYTCIHSHLQTSKNISCDIDIEYRHRFTLIITPGGLHKSRCFLASKVWMSKIITGSFTQAQDTCENLSKQTWHPPLRRQRRGTLQWRHFEETWSPVKLRAPSERNLRKLLDQKSAAN